MSAPDEKKVKVGFEGNWKEIELKRISKDDILPWQPGDKLDQIGKRHDRTDAVAKVTGKAKYTYDRHPEGMLYAKIARSNVANGRIKSIDLTAAKAMPGVKAVIGFDTLFERKSVFHAWTGLAAVAAETEQQAEAAADAIKVEWEEVLPFCATTEAAMAPNAPKVGRRDQKNVEMMRPGGRNADRWEAERAERKEKVEALMKGAAKIVEATFETQVQLHHSLETHGHLGIWSDDGLLVYSSTQGTFSVRGELHERMKAKQTRVLSEYVGGGFGSKFSADDEGVAACELSKLTGRPVKLMLDRREEATDAGNRPDSIQKIKIALDAEGKIIASEFENWGTSGPNANGGGAKNDAIYNLGLVLKTEWGVRTNAGEARAMRAPGWPQGIFGLEGAIDMAAEAAGIDPIEFRKRHDSHPIRGAEYDIARKMIGWDEKRRKKPGEQAGPLKTGVGVACNQWFNAGGRGATVRVRITKEGHVDVRNGAQDIGTGTRTIMGLCVAEELGITMQDLTTFIGDTNDPPGPGSGGSTTIGTLTPAARLAGFKAKQRLLEIVAEKEGWKAEELDLKGGFVVKKDGQAMPKSVAFKAACAMMLEDAIEVDGVRQGNFEGFTATNAGVQCAEVEVDVETGVVRVIKVAAVQDSGKILNHKAAESQVSGGVIQGVSFALHERRTMDRHKGHCVNGDLEMYKIAGPVDCPEIDVHLLDVFNGQTNTGVMGLGEPPTIATAAAIANAVYNAIGVRITSLPITPKKVLTALAAKEGEKK